MMESIEKIDCEFCKRVKNLEKDSLFLTETKEAVVFAGDHQFYPGYCVVVSKSHIREMHLLPEETRVKIFNDVMNVGKLVFETYSPWKINYASLGNVMEHRTSSQLHVLRNFSN